MERESSLVEADMKALQELEQERIGSLEENEANDVEVTKNGAIEDGAFNNNMANSVVCFEK